MRPLPTEHRTTVLGLTLANLLPLVGVLAFGWGVHTLLVIYWIESGVIGAAYVQKIRRAEGVDDPDELPSWRVDGRPIESFVGEPNRRIAGFFARFFGVFWLGHGLFVLVGSPSELPSLGSVSPGAVAVAALGLVAHHAVSYRLDSLEKHEYERNGPVTLVVEPLSRVFVLHVTIVLGAIPVALLGAPVGAVIVMVLAKTTFDIAAHRREHDRAQRRPSVRPSARSDDALPQR